TPEGVFKFDKQGEPQRISGPIVEVAKTRDVNAGEWGTQLEWLDQDGKLHARAFPASRLQEGRNSSFIKQLASEGLQISPRCSANLLDYLAAFNSGIRLCSVAQTGWVNGRTNSPNANELVYTLPTEVIALSPDHNIVFQTDQHCTSRDTLHGKGTLEQWQAQVAHFCEDNPVLLFSLAVAFTGPLLSFAGMDCCGFHLYGKSSQGKTTALQVAASVWGNGSDPAASPDAYIQRWNATANALEGLAVSYNDGLLVLDEMATCDAFDFGKVVYNLSGGQGKARLSKDSELKRRRSWTMVYLSSGEISAQQKMGETGKPVKAGQLNRLIDIPVSGKIIENSHGQAPGHFADQLKRACGNCYGTAAPVFIRKLIGCETDGQALSYRIRTMLAEAEEKLKSPVSLAADQQRSVRRFALVMVAGQLAVEFGILPFSRADIEAAVKMTCSAWLNNAVDEDVRGVLAVRDFISRYQDSKFMNACTATSYQPVTHDMAGYYLSDQSIYVFTDEGFKRACDGYPPEDVARELKRLGLLFTNDGQRLKAKVTLPDLQGRPRRYAVKKDLLSFELPGVNSGGTGGTPGQGQ
ncbi:MAG: DUF927 domain-containing protein, partial [Pseudomonadales bacterium]|nr:DUF927 domain-containing protein [Pseudomonadales bacterium]